MSETQEERRKTLTERHHELVMAMATKPPREPYESVEISRNAKGDVQFTVAASSRDGESLADVLERARTAFIDLHTHFELSRTQEYGRKYTPDEKGGKGPSTKPKQAAATPGDIPF
jgi:hypothetical protein